MPTALFFNVPGHGHVNPTLPLVAELVRRGHRITYFVTEDFRAAVEAAGAAFCAYNTIHDDYFDARKLSGSAPQRVALALITTAGEILPELLDITRTEKPDYILFDGMCPWGNLVAQILHLPAIASLSLSPMNAPPPRAMLKIFPFILPVIFRDFGKGVEAIKQARALTKQYNLPPLGFAGIMNNLGDISISYTSTYFQPFVDSVPNSVRFVGWTLRETPANESFPFERVGGRKLIYVSLGTLNNDDAAFFRMCIEALADNDDFVIMSTGNRISPESFGTLPENVSIHAWVPQTDVLRRAALFITHGGLNSLHDGLYCGVPLLLVPQQVEQLMNAMRVVELGAGLMLKKGQVSVHTIRSSAARLLTESQFAVNATRIGDTFRAAGGVRRAADEIEELLRKRTNTAN